DRGVPRPRVTAAAQRFDQATSGRNFEISPPQWREPVTRRRRVMIGRPVREPRAGRPGRGVLAIARLLRNEPVAPPPIRNEGGSTTKVPWTSIRWHTDERDLRWAYPPTRSSDEYLYRDRGELGNREGDRRCARPGWRPCRHRVPDPGEW